MPPKTTKKTYKRKTTSKKVGNMDMNKMKNMIKKIQLKSCETKYKTLSLPKNELYHNSLNNFSTNLWGALPGQGDSDAGREGDQINMTGLMFRLMIGQKLDRPNVTFKIFVIEYDDALSGNATTYGDLFHNITGNGLLDPIQAKRWKVRYATTLRNTKSSVAIETANKEYVRTKQFWIPYRKLVNFKADDSIKATNLQPQLNIVCLAYDAYGTLITDNIGYWQGAVTCYYKDP